LCSDGGVAARRPDWERLARGYDWQLALERPALRALLALLDVREQERLLDLGTGTAALLRELARRRRRPRQAVGLDSSPAMLARATSLPPGWQLVRGEAEQMPFGDGGFDVATATYLLHILDAEQRANVLGELRRVLRPKGRLGLVTVAPASTRLGSWLTLPIRTAAERRGGALVGLRPLDPRPELTQSGFRVTADRRVRRGYPSLCVVAKRE
jgi:ubiquinone/menaquinone biosynthesis C-methylase UbiE